jgi:hypothetical protein
VLANHIHLIVECDDEDSLARGMRGLNTRLAKRLNKVFRRRGKLIAHRFHDRSLATPLEVRRTLAYVILNQRHHAARAGRVLPPRWIDSRSSGLTFTGWRESPHDGGALPDLGTSPARCWLLRVGWRRHGTLAFDEHDPVEVQRARVSRPRTRP